MAAAAAARGLFVGTDNQAKGGSQKWQKAHVAFSQPMELSLLVILIRSIVLSGLCSRCPCMRARRSERQMLDMASWPCSRASRNTMAQVGKAAAGYHRVALTDVAIVPDQPLCQSIR